ncbi:MAG: hypothetical protein ACE5JK_07150 [Candidatus Omnitrophota bacterium]
MSEIKTKAIDSIEKKMDQMNADELRYQVLKSAKNFKSSWISLGQILYTVWKDKLYKDWGFTEFESYASKEIGIRKETAFKLLRSYSFLEKDSPRYLTKDYNEGAQAREVPTYEAVDVLRKASNNKKLDREDYAKIKKYVLEGGKGAGEVKKDLTQMIKQQEELDPAEERKKKRVLVLKRFVGVLKSIRNEIKVSRVLPEKVVKDVDKLISKLESGLV